MRKIQRKDRTYSDLEDQLLAIVVGLDGVENGRELVTLEFH